ncbi:hypothetical protein SAMN02745121_01275 [Nannocystis exedens]|uniref:Uncharacterized protein n=1 Tax=Nannocystis exedens TaxID=54 RepID=A0A1I1UT30_9BACT|nr:hypothetical protein [Nannocystis exedens]PCC72066.1 hypothetical protein NAEX_05145 [Nannocystis exedens]SFD73745.1 hypothetical protein SAMN02745121_01275 [Nannocystis exedens]
MTRSLLTTLFCCLAACSGAGNTNESATSDGSTTTVEAEGACECDPEAEDESCGPQLCPVAFLHCEQGCEVTDQPDEEIEHMQCVLTALRDRTPGFVAWVFTQDAAPSWSWTGVRIFADGSAAILRRATAPCQVEGTPAASGPDETVLLKDTAYFDGCLAEPDPLGSFQCMQEPVMTALSECAPRVENCE